ncbi:hypothetical protein ACP4OV_002364 [Aristida adscensionis]
MEASSGLNSRQSQGTPPSRPNGPDASLSRFIATMSMELTSSHQVSAASLGNAVSELQVVGSSSSSRLTLREVAAGRVDLVAEKMRATPEEQLMLVQGRVDLTPAALSTAHRAQLMLLVAIKTGNRAFTDPGIRASSGDLAGLLLDVTCRNSACWNYLLDRDCECSSICARRPQFCRHCMCVICSEFDSESDSCRWVECGVCCHRAHTSCAIHGGHIGVGVGVGAGQTTAAAMSKNNGHGKMLFRCQACQGTSELLRWVREIFHNTAHLWKRDALLRELGYVCEIFHPSVDPEERNLFRKCAELHKSLKTGGSAVSMRRGTLLQAVKEMFDQENKHEALEHILIDSSADPIELSYDFLENITNDFSEVIGRGGFGEGVLRIKKVAVKKLFQIGHFSEKQFEDELTCLRRVRHKYSETFRLLL